MPFLFFLDKFILLNIKLTGQAKIWKFLTRRMTGLGQFGIWRQSLGGLVWMTAAGSNEKVQKGKDILIWATIGLVIIFISYALTRFVLVDVFGATEDTTSTGNNGYVRVV